MDNFAKNTIAVPIEGNEKSYLDYAMSVIVGRAYQMHEMVGNQFMTSIICNVLKQQFA